MTVRGKGNVRIVSLSTLSGLKNSEAGAQIPQSGLKPDL